jgi:hypothetical protein
MALPFCANKVHQGIGAGILRVRGGARLRRFCNTL